MASDFSQNNVLQLLQLLRKVCKFDFQSKFLPLEKAQIKFGFLLTYS